MFVRGGIADEGGEFGGREVGNGQKVTRGEGRGLEGRGRGVLAHGLDGDLLAQGAATSGGNHDEER